MIKWEVGSTIVFVGSDDGWAAPTWLFAPPFPLQCIVRPVFLEQIFQAALFIKAFFATELQMLKMFTLAYVRGGLSGVCIAYVSSVLVCHVCG